MFALFQRIHDVLCTLLRHAFESGHRLEIDDSLVIQIGQRSDDIPVDELVDQLVTQTFNIHRTASGKMQDGLLALCGTEQTAGTPRSRLAFLAHHMAAAYRTGCRHDKSPRICGPLVRQYADDLGNHIARAAHNHGIADVHVLATDLVFVVQRRVADCRPADKYRFQLRHRSKFTGASDLHFDIPHNGELLFRRKFVCDCPARLARNEAKFLARQDY